ncbi:MAG: hypothetical protein M3071_10310 [Actinomycetota bacterium]|nr:hypothetical protein [Actinomycetota bacterium]
MASPSGSDSNSGSAASPFRTPQKLVDALAWGQTGCLMGGKYDLAGGTSGSQLKFNHGGSSGAPLTLESYPGQMATLTGGPVYVPHGSDYVDITNLSINTQGTGEVGVQIMGAYDQITDDNITNLNTPRSCIILGSDTGYGQAAYPLVADNVIHQCGYFPSDPFEDHGVYDDNTIGAVITNNVFWGMPYGWGVQLYPNSQGTQVTHNVIDNNGNGVVVGGNSLSASSNNTIADNIISGSSNEYNIQSWWGGAVGTRNVAENNCVWGGNQGNVESPMAGVTATRNPTADPGYTDAAAHNNTLPAASPCLTVVGYDPATVVAASMSSRTPTTTVPSTGKIGRGKARKARSAQARAGQAQAGQAQAGQGRGRHARRHA